VVDNMEEGIHRVLGKYSGQRDTFQSVVAIISNWVYIFLAVIVDYNLRIVLGYNICTIMTLLLITSRLRAFEVLVHEASHYNLFHSIEYHFTLEPLYGYPVLKDLPSYVKEHRAHHCWLGDKKKDPDWQQMQDYGFHELPRNMIWIFFLKPLLGYYTFTFLSTTCCSFLRGNLYRKLAFCSAFLIPFIYFNLMDLFFMYYCIPLFVLLPIIRVWIDAGEHVHLLENKDRFSRARSVTGFVNRYFLHPYGDGYHLVHHLSPRVPFYFMEKAHEELMNIEGLEKRCIEASSLRECYRQLSNPALNMRV
jgi:fatty acid desaturase